MKLAEYRKKRKAEQTPEPAGEEPTSAAPTQEGSYVVHLHEASHRHYDLRLEVGGALESFSVPRGPTLDPHERRLAVHTEPHPIKYLDFEDVIPEGNYGAGSMIAWDRGRVQYLGKPAEEQLAAGKLDFELSGHKLHGRFALVHIKKAEKEWLLFKKNDAFAAEGTDIVTDQPRSILSGMTVEELRGKLGIAQTLAKKAARLGAPAQAIEPDMVPMHVAAPASKATKSKATKGKATKSKATKSKATKKSRASLLYELKLDGVRVIAQKSGQDVTLKDRKQTDVTQVYPEIARAVRALAASRVTLDGEIVALDEAGQPSFERLKKRIDLVRADDIHHAQQDLPVVFAVFDLLSVEARDLRPLPLRSRRDLLGHLLPGPGTIRVLDAIEGDPGPLLELCRARGLGGLIAKRADAPYQPGPAHSSDWIEIPCAPAAKAPREEHDEAEIERLSAEIEEGGDKKRKKKPGKTTAKVKVKAKKAGKAEKSAPVQEASRVTLSHPDKVLWPGKGFTKQDLADYYQAVAPALLPHLRDRPVMLVRYPDGIEGKSFYQWSVPARLPSWIETLRIELEGRESMDVFHIRDVDTLLYVTNMAAIPIHVLASRASTLGACDFFTIDLDVSGGTFENVITLARSLRSILEEIGLTGFPKTSGQSGLHIFVALGPGISYEAARTFADLIGHLLVQRHPDIATMERMKVKRGPRVYVDTGQTGPSRTIVAPYAARAVREASVSMPLDWDEVTEALDPRVFDLRAAPVRVAKDGDRLAALLEVRPSVPAAAERLEKLARGGKGGRKKSAA
jgi:bifunctional non-homologous end joining protein LigD